MLPQPQPSPSAGSSHAIMDPTPPCSGASCALTTVPGTVFTSGVGAVRPPAVSDGHMRKTGAGPTSPLDGVQRTASLNAILRIAGAFCSEARSVARALRGMFTHAFLAADHR